MPVAQRHYDIRVLNRLISLTLDSAEQYSQAMGDARSAELTQVLRIRCRERLALSARLRDQVDAIGGDPKDDGSLVAPLQRAMSNLYYVLHEGDWAVVEEVDRREGLLKQKYCDVLQEGHLSPQPRETVLGAYETIQSAREELAKLKRIFRRGHR
ncbi:PA2169 family four-helix-bundle protein [Dyella acidiphila]|uniref:PA2169 family four-helix-bundle protein n=1 Tax=Dyella acidiphila TaxID=2775866 RepID=A0ABR9GCP8_9GAMM|nr:PA2169 family four-helix-bundle protein [Dyella acidiphila]MBE1161820.1 PA2169 family four-helix-bundle protein [Dyella acidiphila]